jgi:hypothetical protein
VTVFVILPKAMGKKDDGPVQAAITWEERYAAWKEFWDFEKWGLNKDRKCGSSLFSLLPFPSVNGHERWLAPSSTPFFETQAQTTGGWGAPMQRVKAGMVCFFMCAVRLDPSNVSTHGKGFSK